MNRTTTNLWDIAKIIGLGLMFIDHAGHFYFVDHEWLRGIGRGAAPIFLFLTGLATHYRFSRELLVLAVVLTISDWLVKGGVNTLNILWTILFARLLLAWLEKRGKKIRPHEWAIGCIVWFPTLMLTQYGSLGLLLALCGFVYKHSALYPAHTPKRFLALSLLLLGGTQCIFAEYESLTVVCVVFTLVATAWLLHKTATQTTRSFLAPAWLQWMSRYSGYIYVAHLIILGWHTRIAL